jgi:Tfp pilus assembly protein FimT
MIVVTITSLLALMAAPRFTTLMQRTALRSGRQTIEAMVATARAGAIQKGRNATFWVKGQAMGVRAVINDAGQTVDLIPSIRLDSIHKGMSLTLAGSADTAIVFSSRGYASPRLVSPVIYRLTMGSRTDSTCVSTIGHIIGQTCSQ